MLEYFSVFLILAIVAAIFGFLALTGIGAIVAQTIFGILFVAFLISLFNRTTRHRP